MLEQTLTISSSPDAKLTPMVGAHIARYTSPPTQYLGPVMLPSLSAPPPTALTLCNQGRGYSGYNPLKF